MIGPSGAGKSTLTRALRSRSNEFVLGNGKSDKEIIKLLGEHKIVIFDNTNTKLKERSKILDVAEKGRAQVLAILFDLPKALTKERLEARNAEVLLAGPDAESDDGSVAGGDAIDDDEWTHARDAPGSLRAHSKAVLSRCSSPPYPSPTAVVRNR
jgi:predicted kinase